MATARGKQTKKIRREENKNPKPKRKEAQMPQKPHLQQ
jgi:hypothetical protein